MQNLKENRYLPLQWLEEALSGLGFLPQLESLGVSEESRPIHVLTLGSGPKKVLIWSQMHGNETTTTKALVDFLSDHSQGKHKALLEGLTLRIIPMLNPDGAERYTRVNANKVDLNRDAIDQTQRESKLLVEEFHRFKPDLCLNLHGQRTIFSAGDPKLPASLSFLSPSYNKERSINAVRARAMRIIAEIASAFPERKEWGIGRYDDGFNINCMGDYFTHHGVPTILFEAGHYPKDYFRDKTRDLVYKAFITALNSFLTDSYSRFSTEKYFHIPENKQTLRDIQISNVTNVNNENSSYFYQYKEVLKNQSIRFIPEQVEFSEDLVGLRQIDFDTVEQNITNSDSFDNNLEKWVKMFASI